MATKPNPVDGGSPVEKQNDTPARRAARDILERQRSRMKQTNALTHPLSASVVRVARLATLEDLVAVGRGDPDFPVVFHVGPGGFLSMEQFDGEVRKGAL